MQPEDKVKVSSQCNGHVGLKVPNRNFVRNWSRKGQVVAIPFEILEEASYEDGFRNMVNQGILHIDDLKAAQELGFEPEEATEPVNYKIYTEGDMKYLLNFETPEAFQEKFSAMPKEQQQQLADMAVQLRFRDAEKTKIIEKTLGINLNKEINFDINMKEV